MLGLVVAGLVGGGVASSSLFSRPAAADVTPVKSVGVQLPVQDLRGIELDENRGRLYIAQGVGAGYPLVVTDLDGRLQQRVDSLADVADVALSADEQTLFAAQGFDRVTALDADSLSVAATYRAPRGACVFHVEPTGSKVVGAYTDCGIGSGGLLVWSASTPDGAPVVYTDGPNYEPIIDASPGAPGLVVAGDKGYSPSNTYLIDVSGATPQIVARRDRINSNLTDIAMSPDGSEVVVTNGYPYEHRSYRLPDLSDATVYPSGAYPVDAAWSGDGSTVAVARANAPNDADVMFYPKDSTTPTYAVDFRYNDNLWPGTLLVNRAGTRAWAVSYDDVYQNVQLLHSFGPAHPPNPPVTDLAITASTGTGKNNHTAYITVTWTSPISTSTYYAGWTLTAATDGAAEKQIWNQQMGATGRYTLAYPLPRGTTTFTARYHDAGGFYPDGYATATLSR